MSSSTKFCFSRFTAGN
ncbi:MULTISPECIES: peptide IlvX [Enterobacteriaceae]|uniref:Peptide IlvX n=1 Tax=Citrobacter bitternis TaxID=1585982 RepID=A0ABW1Q5F2_9ENTR|nr:peptide IlvX [Enterobacteriaceae bacterium]MBY6258808.1 peptide IlvX [Phytobacter diazotrophicus]